MQKNVRNGWRPMRKVNTFFIIVLLSLLKGLCIHNSKFRFLLTSVEFKCIRIRSYSNSMVCVCVCVDLLKCNEQCVQSSARQQKNA